MEERPKTPQKGLLYYYGIVLLGILLFNSLIAPILVDNAIEQVGYNQFLMDVESENISEIELSGEEIFTDTRMRKPCKKSAPTPVAVPLKSWFLIPLLQVPLTILSRRLKSHA